MKTMKVIDLLNKIANKEKVPRKFKYEGITFIYKDCLGEHFDEKGASFNYTFDLTDYDVLNDEVKIIEDTPEDKKIEKLNIEIQDERTGNAYIRNEYGTKCYLTKHSKIIANKINEIIDKINGGENV